MKKHIALFVIVALHLSSAIALEIKKDSSSTICYKGAHYHAGDTIHGYKEYVYLVVGDMDSPLLLGIPHDGIEEGRPKIPETGKTGRDIYTQPFSEKIAMLFEKDTNKKPWLVVNKINRKRVDPNTYPDQLNKR